MSGGPVISRGDNRAFFLTTHTKGKVMKNIPNMTRQHFQYIADTLKSLKPPNGEKDVSWPEVCRVITHALSRTNGRFKNDKFLEACGYIGDS
jgi:hypothetical protein